MMRVFTRRSNTTAVVAGIVSIAVCFCLISVTTTPSTFVHAATDEGSSNNKLDNVNIWAEDAFQDRGLTGSFGKGRVFDGSAVSEEEEEGGVEGCGLEGAAAGGGVGMTFPCEMDPGRMAGSFVRQPAAEAAGGEGGEDLDGQQDVDVNAEAVKGEVPAANSNTEGALKSTIVEESSNVLTHRTSKSKHHHHQGHGHGQTGEQHGKRKKAGVHRHGQHHGHGGKKHGHQHYPHHDGEHMDPKHGHELHDHPHKHHDHYGGKKPPRVKYSITRQLNLICEKQIIDRIKCHRRPSSHPSQIRLGESSPINDDENDYEGRLYALNTRRRVKQSYVFMSSPCSNALPPPFCESDANNILVRPTGFEDGEDDVLEPAMIDKDEEVDHDKDEDSEDDEEDDDDYKEMGENENELKGGLEAANNDGLHHHRQHRHRKHHRHPVHNPVNQQPLIRSRHPYLNLCVAKGNLCGSRLFGCRFQRTTLYDCQAVGSKPLVRLINARVCGGFREDPGYSNPHTGGGSKSGGGSRTSSGERTTSGGGSSTSSGGGTTSRGGVSTSSGGGSTPGGGVSTSSGGGSTCASTSSGGGNTSDGGSTSRGGGHTSDGGSTSRGGGHTSDCGSTSQGGGHTTNGTDPSAGQDACKCATGTTASNISPICGSQLPARCNMEPNAIYFCPHGPGSIFELLHICQPGSQCRASSTNGADPVCGGLTCDCTGSNELCGYQFPDNCPGISKNTAYKCSLDNGGKPVMVKECSSDRTCVSVSSGGTLCASNDCLCPVDGTACGEIFPLKCGLPTTALYKCVKGEKPVFMQNCSPGGRCSATSPSDAGSKAAAMVVGAAGVVFEGLANNDCLDACRCTSPGIVSGNTFPLYCKLEPNRLYSCGSSGSSPVPGERCTAPNNGPSTRCTINCGDDTNPGHSDGGNGEEKPLTCSCKSVGGGILAGGDMSPGCNADPTVTYFCPKDGNGSGTDSTGGGGSTGGGSSTVGTGGGSTTVGTGGGSSTGGTGGSNTTVGTGDGDSSKPPVILQQCPPGTLSQGRPRPLEPQCGFSTCNCTISTTGNVAVCSEQFPLRCNLVPNSVYKCSTSGVPELVSTCSSSQTCVAGIYDRAVCVASATSKDGCKCTEDGTICGSAFPLSCGLSSTKVFKCRKGLAPVLEFTCRARTTCLTTPTATQCVDTCACAVQGDVCGASFPPRCKFDAKTIYKCAGAGVAPITGQSCAKGCVIQASADICLEDGPKNENECSCETVGVGNVCGSDLPTSCKAEANTIYTCRDAKQSAPEALSACHPGTLCEKRPFPAGAACGATSCNCTINGEICSDNIRETCGLNLNSIYRCFPTGDTPVSIQNCDSSSTCVNYNNNATCVSNACICAEEGEVCGDAFPLSCKLKGSTIYTCAKGQAPIAKRDCGLRRCSAALPTTGDRCIDPCSCEGSDVVCGSTFPSTCSLNKDTLYRCSGLGFRPIPITLCGQGQCVVNAGPDTCNGPSTPIDPSPEDICTCPSLFTPVCGRTLLRTPCKEIMEVDPNLVYHCPSGAGSLPELQHICQPGSICITQPSPIGASCGGRTCNCTGTEEICSSAFKAHCGLGPNNIYKCTPSGTPRLVQQCTSDQVCVTHTNGSQCVSSDCICETDGVACGEKFHFSCGLKGTALYDCKTGEPPVFVKDFGPNRCSSYEIARQALVDELEGTSPVAAAGGIGAPAKASTLKTLAGVVSNVDDLAISSCLCTVEVGIVCGQSFPQRCGLNGGDLYRCDGPNLPPEPADVCPGTDACVVHPGDDNCDDCRCTGPNDVCGLDFPESCAYEPDELYSCPGGLGSEPIPFKKCDFNGCAEEVSGNSSCGPTDPCKCTDARLICGSEFPDQCNLNPQYLYNCTRRGKLPIKADSCGFGCLKNFPAEADRCKADPSEVEDCTCRDASNACGSTFPNVCGFDSGSVYLCGSGKGSSPKLNETCESGQCLVKEGVDDVCDPTVTTTTTSSSLSTTSPSTTTTTEPTPLTTSSMSTSTSSSKPALEPTSTPTSESTSEPPTSTTTTEESTTPLTTLTTISVATPTTISTSTSTATSSTPDSASGHTTTATTIITTTTTATTTTTDSTVATSSTATTQGLGTTSMPVVSSESQTTTAPIPTTTTATITTTDSTITTSTATTQGLGTTSMPVVSSESQTTTTPIPTTTTTTATTTVSTGDTATPQVDTTTPSLPITTSAPTHCMCQGKKAVCGSAFPEDCMLEANRIYDCSASGTPPVAGDKCPLGCTTQSEATTSDECNKPDCSCQKTGTLCGRSMQSGCNFSNHSIYDCTNGVGSTPVSQKLCVPGTTCLETAEGASCGGSKCTCTGDMSVCSNQFPDGCGFKKNAVYKCTPSGRPVLDEDCTGDQSCVSVVSGATCTSADCKCTEDGSVCGRRFPSSCNLNASSVYTCHSGDSPIFEKTCSPAYCDVTAPSASPLTDDCLDTCTCPSADLMCGSTFAEECGLDAGSLYKCTAIGIAPVLEQNCTNGQCTTNMGPDICGSAVEPPSRCFCNSTATICGSSLDPTCESVLGEPVDSNSTYTCSGDGQKPVKDKACTVDEVCTQESTGAQCESLCTCTGTDTKCSKEFPEACHLPEGVYKCGADGKPQKEQDCASPDVCVDNVCTPPECLCKNNNSRCSSTFPDECGLLVNTVYECQAAGTRPLPPVGSCGSGVCSADVLPPDPSHSLSDFCIKQCECKEAGAAVCASTFAPVCGLDGKVLMNCGKLGDIPTLQDNCTLSCEENAGAPDACKFDPCACSAAGDVCGSSFPNTCTYETQSIYSCKAAAVLPEKKAACASNEVCLQSPAGPVCTPEDCICMDDVSHCGSTFVDACGLKNDTLYKCVNGSLPNVDHDCAPGICSANIVAGQAVFRVMAIDSCIDLCACKESNVPVCGSVFDTSCNYKAMDLMECENVGDVPTVNESCTASCKPQAGPDVCALDPCACTKAGDTCGSAFPDACTYEKDTQYTCSSNKALPVKIAACPTANVCLVNSTGSVCTPPECICKDDAYHCGSTFAASCSLDSNTLYECTNGALPTLLKDCGSGTCSANVVVGSAAFGALADDKCIDQCACKEASVLVCASTFSSSCGYDSKSLMACANAGDIPIVNETCTLSCTAQPGPDVCTLDPCACTKAGDACSGSFPDTCGLEKDTVYSCAGAKAPPTKKETCAAATVCLETPTGPTCTPPDCICRDEGSHCGSTFVSACSLNENTLYKCTNGQLPTLTKDCGVGTCSANVVKGTAEFRATADDICIDQCACKEAGVPVCGGAFDPVCAYDSKALMDCASVADVPTINENCTLSCDKKAGPDACTLDPCACTAAGDTCGNTFPSTCPYEKDSVYTCTDPRKLPTKKEACPSPQVCLVTPSGPVCTPEDCICKDDDSHCGSTFLDSCKLQKNTLYKCTAGGLATFVKDCGAGTCSANVVKGTAVFRATADDTCIDQCACKEANVTVCSSVFDPICNHKAKDLMECTTVGDVPTVKESCTASCTTQPGSDVCAFDPCACTKAGDICSQTFPATCGYTPETVYSCSGNKALPTEKSPCGSGTICLATPSGPTCTPPDCICKDEASHCGSTFVGACNLQNNTLYKCTNGQLPTSVKDCGTGTCSANIVKGTAEFSADADDMCIDQCACKEAGVPICASAFDSTCNYDAKALMDCANVGDVPSVMDACTLSCTKQSGPDVCTFDPCACTMAGDACGSTLPPNCGYEEDSVYTCSAIKALPKKKSACETGKVCLEIPTGPTCTPPDCICKDSGSHCGSTFVDACNLQRNALYKCTNGSLPNFDKDCGAGTCSANVVMGTAQFRATADDNCIDQCACKEASVPICASAFDAVCNYNATDLMACGAAGDVPTVAESCTLSCTKQPGPDVCTFDPCACTKNEETCGSAFPVSCNDEVNSQYTCAGNKTLPVKKAACPTGNVCLITTAGSVCTPPECICSDDIAHCGSTLPTTCNLQSNTLYKCTKGHLPKSVQDCGTGTCSANVVAGTAAFAAMAEDRCLDQCACKEANIPVCASVFDPSCNYGNTSLMSCGNAGDVPAVMEACTLSCTKQPGPDVCTFDPCACTKAGDACGSTLPPNCGYEKDSIYTCSAIKALPQKKSACGSDNVCLETPAGPTCTPPDCICQNDGSHCGSTFVDACNLQKNMLYKCTNGSLPNFDKDCGAGTCSANVVKGTAAFRATADDTCIDQCACKDANVPVCASAFDAACNYNPKVLMSCGEVGDVPTDFENCTLSCTTQPGPDFCTFDPCACTDTSESCGKAAPETCGFEKETQYTCSGDKALPIKKAACATGTICHLEKNVTVCTPPECVCTDNGHHCGSTFAASCNLQSNSLYACIDGSLPKVAKDCGTGTCSANVVAGTAAFGAMADDRCLDLCACKEASVPVCASAFDASCNYGNKSLMTCGNAGDVPSVMDACTLSCTKQPGPDVCTFDPCACTMAGDACGGTLPPNCGYEVDSVYTCSAVKALPKKKSACETDKVCREIPSGPTCTPPDCICQDSGSHCGSTFVDACNLQKNALYKCTNGSLPSFDRDCGTGTCSANVVMGTAQFRATADDNCIDQCACKEANVPICASAFDAVCNYNATDLMACGAAGDVPTVAESCTLSCTKQPGPDVCTLDPCACTKAEDTCGSSFPDTCGYEKTSRYSCAGERKLPVKKDACPTDQVCLKTGTLAPVCTSPDCICKDDDSYCGSRYPAVCSLQSETLYTCTLNALPVSVRDCAPGVCSANIVAGTAVFSAKATGDTCVDQCACKEAGVAVCANTFNPSCNYDNKTLLDCANVGVVPTVKENCTLTCTAQPGPDVCTFDLCACTKTGDVCGNSLDPTCGYEKTSVYTCGGNKLLPTKKDTCPTETICLETTSGPTCTPPDCVCKADGSHCGSTFIPACKLESNTMYKCTNGALPSSTKDCTPGTCSANVVAGLAMFRAMADDTCIDQCACKEANVPICASTFDPVCNYDNKSLMTCGNVGDVPSVMDACTLSCTKQSGPDVCTFDPCACTMTGDACGSTLPPNCGYEVDSVYTCSAIKALPKKKFACDTDKVCREIPTGPACTPPDCICLDDGLHCGSTFIDSCLLQKNSLYKCTNGSLPSLDKDCGTGTCSSNVVQGTAEFRATADDSCLDLCACKEAGVPVCASAFDPVCNYNPKELRDCGQAGDVPTVKESCTLSCTKQAGPDKCTFDPCACTESGNFCGSALPVNCGYEANTLYTCQGASIPVVTNNCLPGICSANTTVTDANPGAVGVDTCIEQCACKQSATMVCGSTFNASCGFNPLALMECGSFADTPKVKETCTLACDTTPDPDECKFDVCACSKAGDVCGSALAGTCGYNTNTVYSCAANKTLPGTIKDCSTVPNGVCLSTPSGPTCTPVDCICKDDGSHCGSTFLDACNLQKNSLYKCTNGSLPSMVKDCGTGTCSANVITGTAVFRATADDTCIDQCACKEANVPVCASAFDSVCNYGDKQLMTCGGVGDVPTVLDNCTLSCTKQPGPDLCTVDPCACTKAGDTCGSIFPDTCNYEKNSRYACSDAKALPANKVPCASTETCLDAPTGASCLPTDCVCKDDHAYCGSTFAPICGLQNNTLYRCHTGAASTVAEDCGLGICSANFAGLPDSLTNLPDNFCIDKCKCTVANQTLCASTFDASCNFNTKDLMSCTNINDAPTVAETCTKSCSSVANPQECEFDDCACPVAGDTCGSAFAVTCSYELNTVYTCAAEKALPVKSNPCPPHHVCIFTPEGTFCTPPECICMGDGLHCGSFFSSTCNLKSNSLYTCVNEALPSFVADCDPGTCSQNVVGVSGTSVVASGIYGTPEFHSMAADRCIDLCACKETNVTVCASAFDPSCSYGNTTLMACGNVGDVPTVKGACTSPCIEQPGGDVCPFDSCACTESGSFCGSALPANCGYEANTLYTCKSSSIPAVTNNCLPGICSANTTVTDANPGTVGVDTCIEQCACKQSATTVCGSTFNASCGFNPLALMECGSFADTPKVKETCTLACDTTPDPDECKFDVCACSKAGDVCGSALAGTCGYNTNTVYSCAANKTLPGTIKDCSTVPNGVCLSTPSGPTCTPVDCICKDDGSHCGSTFLDACNLQKNSLYKCTNGSLPSMVKDCGTGTCSANVITGTAVFRATADDTCIDQCACKEANVPVCASAFDSVCNYGDKQLMTCGGVGDVPTVLDNCTLSCTRQPGPDICTLDPCACTKAGDTCGSIFPDTCNYDKNSRYTCSNAKALPANKVACASTETCLDAPTGASCLPTDCVCKDDHAYCGSTFAPICGLQNNTLYRCHTGAASTVAEDCGPGICSANFAGLPDSLTNLPDNFCIDKCKCTVANQTLCASTFDASCNFNTKDLMSCTNINDAPTVAETCTKSCSSVANPQECEFDDCACPVAGDTCGSAFAVTCSYELNTVYTCAADKALPVKSNPCPPHHVCIFTPEGTFCTPPECICMGDGMHCGSFFSSTCNLKNNSLYNCVNEALPSFVTDCDPGTCSQNVVGVSGTSVVASGIYGTPEFHSMAADKCIDLCACKEANVTVCASAFDPSCNYGNASLMACGNVGDVPTVKGACTSPCIEQPGGDVCPFDPCACTKAGDTCGSSLPASCGYISDTVYTCATTGTTPETKLGCNTGEVCTEAAAGPSCTSSDCICKDDGSHCGSTFLDVCNLQKNSLYKCTNGSLPSMVKDCGTGTCSANVITGTAVFRATADDTCIDQCACKEANVPVCASAFDSVCNYGDKQLMTCGGVGDVPTVLDNCTLSCARQPGPDICTVDPCACTKAGDTCGSIFPDTCNYEKNSRYTCSDAKALPANKVACASTETCLDAPTGASCLPTDCVCKDDHAYCGSTFAPICGLQNNTLYRCHTGAASTVAEDCGLGICSANFAGLPDSLTNLPDNFCIDKCKCTVANQTLCASTFDASCNFNTKDLMSCTNINDAPTVAETCTKSCSSVANPQECEFDNCACPVAGDTCGSAFAVTCSYELNTVYTCAADKALPVKSNPCPPHHVCIFTPEGTFCTPPECICMGDGMHCGSFFSSTCNLKNNSLYSCVNEALPSFVTDCDPGTCSQNVVGVSGTSVVASGIYGTPEFHSMAADKCIDLCACKETNVTVCASAFDPSCNYGNTTLMACGNVGDVPTVKGACTSPCIEQPGGDVCPFDPCACTKVGDTCGSSLPASCGYISDTVYTCVTTGTTPGTKLGCNTGEVCTEAAAGPSCTSSDCICKDDGQHCGSQFPASCALLANTLYSCTMGQVPAVLMDCGGGTCSANIVSVGKAEFMAAGDDICVDKCACQADSVPVCAASFPTECGYDNRTLMSCGNQGDVPVVSETCTAHCNVNINAPDVCSFDPCACPRVGDTCGRAFPANCGYLTDSLYTCAANRTLPIKKSDCQSSETCQTVPGGVDICVANDICDCVGSGTSCTDRFPAKCAMPASSVVTCPAGTVTACPNGCALSVCQAAGCTCVDNNIRCGSSFSPACSLLPNALYTCVNGQAPVLKSDCGGQACAWLANNAVCQDPCMCRSLRPVCGSAFPTSCGLLKDTLYSCPGIGLAPAVVSACAAGCYASKPDASCKKECATAVAAATAQITTVNAAMTALIPSSNVTNVVYPPLIAILNNVATNLTTAKNDLKALALIARPAGVTVESALQLLTTAQSDFRASNFTTSVALNNSLPDLQYLIQQVVACAGSTTTDCSGIVSLYRQTAANANTKAALIPTAKQAQVTSQLATITTALENTLTTGDTTTLRATGQTFGALIGQSTGNVALYGDISNSLLFMYDAFGEALKCKGVNATLFADKCSMYRDRLQGVLGDFIQFIQDSIGSFPVVGPLIINPLLNALKALLIDLQNGIATSVGGIVALLYGILQMINIVSPANQTNSIRDYLLRLVGLLDIPTECGGGGSSCTGLIQIVRMLGQAVINLVSQIPFVGYMIGVTLNPLLNGLMTALTTGTAAAINSSYNALNSALSVVGILPYFGTIAVPFKYLLDAINQVAVCLTTG